MANRGRRIPSEYAHVGSGVACRNCRVYMPLRSPVCPLCGWAPVADWVILSGELAETPENRVLGLMCDVALVERCDELWLVGGRVSPGMQCEADHAIGCGKPVVDLTHLGYAPPSLTSEAAE